DRADDPGQDTEHAALRARGNGPGRRWLGKQAPVARGPRTGHEYAGLAIELVDGPVDKWLAQHLRGVVDQAANGEVVGAVHHQVVVAEDVERVVRGQDHVVLDHIDLWIDVVQPLGRRVDLGAAH